VICNTVAYECVSKSFRSGRLEPELQMVQPSATRCSSTAILLVSVVSFDAITLCVASQWVFNFVISLSTQSGNFWIHPCIKQSRDGSVGIALGYVLDYRSSGVRFPPGAGNFSFHRQVQNGSWAHPASYPMGTRCSFPGGKAAGAWSWPLTSISCRGQEWVELYLYYSNTSSWRGA
jgi:hypothetical protein